MNIDELATAINRLGAEYGEDPFELFRAATSGDRAAIIYGDDAVDQIELMIADHTPTDLARLDRIVFNNSTGQA